VPDRKWRPAKQNEEGRAQQGNADDERAQQKRKRVGSTYKQLIQAQHGYENAEAPKRSVHNAGRIA
jgi:hypothetical protein